MAAFEYKALDPKGRSKKGLIEADTQRQVRQKLRELGLVPVEITEAAAQSSRSSTNGSVRKPLFQRRIGAAELALITRQLSTLVAAALPIEEALKAVAQQSEKPKHKAMLTAVRAKVLEGHNLADSMAQFPYAFDQLFCAMVAAGEKSGHLDKVLNRLADYTEQRQHMGGKVLQALVYPIVLTIVAIGVVAILLTAVVPKVVEQFTYMGHALPWTTRSLIGISSFLSEFGLLILAIIVLGMIGFRLWLRKPQNSEKYHRLILRLPIIGRVSRGLNTARFARTLSILNTSAVPLLEGMKIASGVLTNRHACRQLAEATERVREGGSLWVALDQTHLFPPMMLHMIASGERSGELGSMLERAADNQDREFESQVTIALGVFEPALVVSMACIVLFIVLAIMQPMLALNNMVSM
ncbi:type II secretion system inner membrane protein GspF [Dongshaea marina]|uniref:type II secretion system inner membrane protein GspF n=1 Tax=Dongshaea marina TaxID=2047966 RepID=UPI000D3EB4E4|nr:type II secretion system inner membrane protein GspF [Dongshaea marina]